MLNTGLTGTYLTGRLLVVRKMAFHDPIKGLHPPSWYLCRVYQFICTCKSSYIGRIKVRGYLWIIEHLPKGLWSRVRNTSNSANSRYLVDTGNRSKTLIFLEIISKHSSSSLSKLSTLMWTNKFIFTEFRSFYSYLLLQFVHHVTNYF